MITFEAIGKPITQGSMRAFVSKATGRAVIERGTKELRAWRSVVAQAARSAMGPLSPLASPVKVSATFVLESPKKPKRAWPRGDTDKLCRALGDAMTGIVYEDDAQICEWSARKTYGSPARAIVEVSEL